MAENGTDRKIYVIANTTYTAIGGEMSNSLTVNGAVIDITDKDSEWEQSLIGTKNWSVSGSFNIKPGAALPQQALFDMLTTGTTIKLFIGKVVDSAPVDGWTGDAKIESFAESNERDASVTRDITFRGTGVLTRISQAV